MMIGSLRGAGGVVFFVTSLFDFIFTPHNSKKNEKKRIFCACVVCVTIIVALVASSQKKTESGGRTKSMYLKSVVW